MTKVSGKCNFRAFFLESRGIETKVRGCYFPMIPNGWQKQGRGAPSCPGSPKKNYFVDAIFFPARFFFLFWVIFGKDSKSQTNLVAVFLVNSEVTMESKKKLDHFSRGVY